MAMQRGQDTCEGVCEDPSTQASKHCTANPFSVSKIVIAQSFYDVASLKLQKNTLFYHNDCELVTCAVVCSIRWCSGQLKRTEKYCRFFGCYQIPCFNKQTSNYENVIVLTSLETGIECLYLKHILILACFGDWNNDATFPNWKRHWNRFGFEKVKGRAWQWKASNKDAELTLDRTLFWDLSGFSAWWTWLTCRNLHSAQQNHLKMYRAPNWLETYI